MTERESDWSVSFQWRHGQFVLEMRREGRREKKCALVRRAMGEFRGRGGGREQEVSKEGWRVDL
eukprot:2604522-Rhodomonas_salina.2